MKVLQTTLKRPMLVNGIRCASMAEAASVASGIIGMKVEPYQIHRILDGAYTLPGLKIADVAKLVEPIPEPFRIKGAPLLRYPVHEKPIDRGIYPGWK